MKLHSPRFEKSLRRGVKRRIKKSPQLRRELRRSRPGRRFYNGYFIFRPFASIFLGILVLQAATGNGHAASGLAVISVWAAACALIHANGLWSRLFQSTDLAALCSLPLTESEIFRWQLEKFGRSTFWLLVDLLVAFGTLGCVENLSAARFATAFGLAFLTWVVAVSLAAVCASRISILRIRRLLQILYPAAFVLFILTKLFWEPVVPFLDRAAPVINYMLPTGWAVSQFELLLPQPSPVVLALLVPAAIVIGTLRNSLARLRGLYVFREVTRAEPMDALHESPGTPSPQATPLSGPDNPSKPRRAGPTEITEIIETRRFLDAPDWRGRGWFEALLWRWLTPRERAVSEMAFPAGVALSENWKKIFKTLAIAIAAGFILGLASPLAKLWALSIGIFFTSVMVLAFLNDTGRAFQPVLSSGIRIPLYTNFAVGFHELSRLMFKHTGAQVPALAAWAVVCGMLIAHLNGLPLMDGINYGLRGACLLVGSRFILIVFGFSSGTNDTARVRIKSLLLILAVVLLGLVFLALGGVGLLLPKQSVAWTLTGISLLDAYLFFRVYGWFYHRKFFDLVNLPRR